VKIETFQYTISEYQAHLTKQHHMTLGYLLGKEYITPEVYDELIDTTVVVAVKNHKHYGRRLIEKFFGGNDNEDRYHFCISEIQQVYETRKPEGPKLEMVVDNENI
jgi:hypothetical protein